MLSPESQIKYIRNDVFAGHLDERHELLVSPDSITISEGDIKQFHEIAHNIPPLIQGLCGIARTALIDDRFRRTERTYHTVRALMDLGWRVQHNTQ